MASSKGFQSSSTRIYTANGRHLSTMIENPKHNVEYQKFQNKQPQPLLSPTESTTTTTTTTSGLCLEESANELEDGSYESSFNNNFHITKNQKFHCSGGVIGGSGTFFNLAYQNHDDDNTKMAPTFTEDFNDGKLTYHQTPKKNYWGGGHNRDSLTSYNSSSATTTTSATDQEFFKMYPSHHEPHTKKSPRKMTLSNRQINQTNRDDDEYIDKEGHENRRSIKNETNISFEALKSQRERKIIHSSHETCNKCTETPAVNHFLADSEVNGLPSDEVSHNHSTYKPAETKLIRKNVLEITVPDGIDPQLYIAKIKSSLEGCSHENRRETQNPIYRCRTVEKNTCFHGVSNGTSSPNLKLKRVRTSVNGYYLDDQIENDRLLMLTNSHPNVRRSSCQTVLKNSLKPENDKILDDLINEMKVKLRLNPPVESKITVPTRSPSIKKNSKPSVMPIEEKLNNTFNTSINCTLLQSRSFQHLPNCCKQSVCSTTTISSIKDKINNLPYPNQLLSSLSPIDVKLLSIVDKNLAKKEGLIMNTADRSFQTSKTNEEINFGLNIQTPVSLINKQTFYSPKIFQNQTIFYKKADDDNYYENYNVTSKPRRTCLNPRKNVFAYLKTMGYNNDQQQNFDDDNLNQNTIGDIQQQYCGKLPDDDDDEVPVFKWKDKEAPNQNDIPPIVVIQINTSKSLSAENPFPLNGLKKTYRLEGKELTISRAARIKSMRFPTSIDLTNNNNNNLSSLNRCYAEGSTNFVPLRFTEKDLLLIKNDVYGDNTDQTAFPNNHPPFADLKQYKVTHSQSFVSSPTLIGRNAVKCSTPYAQHHPPLKYQSKSCSGLYDIESQSDLLFTCLSPQLVSSLSRQLLSNTNTEETSVKSGTIISFIIYATCPSKNDFLFQEAFITTYRCFVTPYDLVDLMSKRLIHFLTFARGINNNSKPNLQKYNGGIVIKPPESQANISAKAFHCTFSFFIRIVDDLSPLEITSFKKLLSNVSHDKLRKSEETPDDEDSVTIFKILSATVNEMICHGELKLAKLMSQKMTEKMATSKRVRVPISCGDLQQMDSSVPPLSSNNGSVPRVMSSHLINYGDRKNSIFSFKSKEIAEQMTLLDSKLFEALPLCECLVWALKRDEGLTPNLSAFTKHFNDVSYWCRTYILKQGYNKNGSFNRTSFLKSYRKFVKIIKHLLDDYGNFNSVLALLSALDSSPITRLLMITTQSSLSAIHGDFKERIMFKDNNNNNNKSRHKGFLINRPTGVISGFPLQKKLSFTESPNGISKDDLNFSPSNLASPPPPSPPASPDMFVRNSSTNLKIRRSFKNVLFGNRDKKEDQAVETNKSKKNSRNHDTKYKYSPNSDKSLESNINCRQSLERFRTLVDSTGSFKFYRKTLAQTQPPCIPYIGLVLQDLTFIDAGNETIIEEDCEFSRVFPQDYSIKCINFTKCWQMFTVLQALKRFKAKMYDIKPDPKIISLFNDFREQLNEDELWKISEKFKPPVRRKSIT